MKIYLVGGAVRDFVLSNDSSTDRDWVVVGTTAKAMLELGYQQVGKDFPVFLHPKTNEEYALARIERKVAPGHQGFSCYADPSVTLEQDLSRRDLTINAMAMDSDNNIIDPYNGQKDCQIKVLRHVSEAFKEDPLRCLRLARFAAQLPGFKVARETLEMCKTMVQNKELETLSKPRIWQEWHKALTTNQPKRFLEELAAMGAIEFDVPNIDFKDIDENSELRLALLTSIVGPEIIEEIQPPKYAQELVQILEKHKKLLPASDGESWLQIFKDLDAFRRPNRLEDWLKIVAVSKVFSEWHHNPKQIMNIFNEVNKIDVQKIIAQGFKNKDISIQLDGQRIAIINELC